MSKPATVNYLFGLCVEAAARRGLDMTGWELSVWAPGDGRRRWRVEADGGSHFPLGAAYRTTAQMETALRMTYEWLTHLPTSDDQREGRSNV